MSEEALKELLKISVLIVEDDEIARRLLISGLKPYCNALYEAKDGCEGVEIFNKFNPDVILTDIHMPVMNGFEMMKEILKIKSHQKFIVFTSYDTDANVLKSAHSGAALFLKKPINIEDLRLALITIASKNEEKLTRISADISINLAKEMIYQGGEAVYLTFLQNKLFWLFAYNLNSLVTYEMIEEFVYEGKAASKGAIQNAVLRLKRELKIKIKNIQEMGYMLVASEI